MPRRRTFTDTVHELVPKKVKFYVECPKCGAIFAGKDGRTVLAWHYKDICDAGLLTPIGGTSEKPELSFEPDYERKSGGDCSLIDYQCPVCDISLRVPEKKAKKS